MADKNFGKIVAIIGPVLDVEFDAGKLPEIYNALRIQATIADGTTVDIVAEVEQHLGENRVRAVAMKPTDGLQRGMKAEDLGSPISVPVGPQTLGRVLNVLGEPVDFPDRPVQSKESWPIHRAAPTLEQQSTELLVVLRELHAEAPTHDLVPNLIPIWPRVLAIRLALHLCGHRAVLPDNLPLDFWHVGETAGLIQSLRRQDADAGDLQRIARRHVREAAEVLLRFVHDDDLAADVGPQEAVLRLIGARA